MEEVASLFTSRTEGLNAFHRSRKYQQKSITVRLSRVKGSDPASTGGTCVSRPYISCDMDIVTDIVQPVYIDGTEDDLIDVKISRRVHAATANIYVNNPLTEDFPTVDKFDWNPTKGPLLGPAGNLHLTLCSDDDEAGWYRISVFGVPSFIEKDDMYLVDPSANWSTFDLVIDYSSDSSSTSSS